MRKAIALFCWLVICFITVHAQQITYGEYFFDTDPGTGHGTGINVTSADSITQNLTFSTTGLAIGFHRIYVRFRDNGGNWGEEEDRLFYIYDTTHPAAVTSPNLAAGEYFFDTDPGPGLGSALSAFTATDSLTQTFTFNTGNLVPGFHRVYIRYKYPSGNWGEEEDRLFYVYDTTHPVPAISPNLAHGEFFIDSDPGVGNGTSLTAFIQTDSLSQTLNIPVGNIAVGNHAVFIRYIDTTGNWGIAEPRTFTVCDSLARDSIYAIGTLNLCSGGALTIKADTAGLYGVHYQWLKNASALPGDTGYALTVSLAGAYTCQISKGGCASTSNVISVVALPTQDNISQTICQGSTYDGHSATGVYIDTFASANGCDSIRTLHLTVTPAISTNISQTICQGTTYYGHGSAGVYVDTFTSVGGCDSIRTLRLTVTNLFVNAPLDLSTCAGNSIASIPLNGSSNTIFTWSNTIPSIGLADTGTGNIPAFTAINTINTPVKAIVTVTPVSTLGQSCSASSISFSITVNPVPTIQVPGTTNVCANAQAPAIHFAANVPYATYSWTNNNTTIGLPATGTGSLPAFTATNPGQATDSAIITVTETAPPVAYITNNGYGNIYALNAATNAVLDTIAVGNQPSGLAVSPDGQRVYVTNYAGGNVSVIDAVSHTVIATVNTGNTPYAVVVSPDNSKVYVANTGSGNIAVINAVANTVLGAYTINASPQSLAISPDGNILYATFPAQNALGAINTANVTFTSIYVGQSPDGIAISPDGSKLYIACNNSNAVSVVSTSTLSVIDSIPVGNTPRAVCVSPDGSRAYVSNANSDNITEIKTSNDSVSATISIGSHPWGLCVTPDGSKLFATNSSGNSVSVISTATNTVSATLTGYAFPQSYCNQFISGTNCGASKSFTIKVTPSIATTITETICHGETYAGHNSTGVYIDTFTSVTGCDSIRTLHLTVNPSSTSIITQSICQGSSYTVGGQTYSSSGTYTVTLTGAAANGCDSIVTLQLTVTNALAPQIAISANQTTICTGDSVKFTATNNGGGSTPIYQWWLNGSPVGNNQNIFTAHALVNGDVIYCLLTSSAGCASPDTAISNSINISVTNHITPSITISADTNSICAGTNVTFTASITGGGNQPIYNWKINNTPSGSGPVFTTGNLANGNIVSCILTSSAGCASPDTAISNLIPLTVNPVVTPTISIAASPAAICQGSADTIVAVSAHGGNAPQYKWLVNNQPVLNTGGVYITDSIAGNATVKCVLISNAQCAITDTVNSNAVSIIVNPLPIAVITPSGTVPVCQGDSVQLSASAGNMSYLWSTHATAASIYAQYAGNYSVTVTNVNNCTAVSAPVTIVVNPLPSVPVISQTGNVLSSSVANSYQWYLNNTIINGATSQSLTISRTGNYSVMVTDSAGCSNISDMINVTELGIENIIGDFNLQIYPNPNDGFFTVQFSDNQLRYVSVYDIAGRCIIAPIPVLGYKMFDVSKLADGAYLLQVTGMAHTATYKLLKD